MAVPLAQKEVSRSHTPLLQRHRDLTTTAMGTVKWRFSTWLWNDSQSRTRAHVPLAHNSGLSLGELQTTLNWTGAKAWVFLLLFSLEWVGSEVSQVTSLHLSFCTCKMKELGATHKVSPGFFPYPNIYLVNTSRQMHLVNILELWDSTSYPCGQALFKIGMTVGASATQNGKGTRDKQNEETT